MDLLLIPVLLSLGGGLIYLSLNGAPRVSLEKVPFGFRRDPFKLNDWMRKRPTGDRNNAARISTEDAELVDLMNDMIAVREQLTDLRLSRAPRPIRRRQGRKPAPVTPTPLVHVELSVAVEDQAEAEVVVRETTAHRDATKEVKTAELEAPKAANAMHSIKESSVAKEPASKLPHPVKAAAEMPALPRDLLKEARAIEQPARPTPARVAEKPAAEKTALPVDKSTAEKPAQVVKRPAEERVEKVAEKQTAGRRPSYNGHNRRYVRI
jgi:hypothetical protein